MERTNITWNRPDGHLFKLELCQYFRSVSVFSIFSVFLKVGIVIGILKYRDIGIGMGIFPRPLLLDMYWKIVVPVCRLCSSLVPYHARVSKRSATPVLLDCFCMYFCREYIYANLSFLDGKICVIDSERWSWVHDNTDITWEAETIGCPRQKNDSRRNYRENKLTEVENADSILSVFGIFRYL